MSFTKKQQNPVQAGFSSQPAQLTPGFEALFEEHWNRLCGVLMRLVGDPDEAEDLALDAFWQLYNHPPQDARNLGGWLYRVATNLGLNALRARKRRQHYETASFGVLENGGPEDPAVEVERRQEQQLVRQALAELKPRSTQLLMLRHSGFSYLEIAQALDVAPNSVGKLLARAEEEFEQRYQRLARQAPGRAG